MKSQNGPVPDQARVPERDRRKRKPSDSTNGFWSEENPSAAALLNALTSLKSHDFSVRLPLHWTGMARQAADAFAEIVVSTELRTKEIAEVRQATTENKALLNALSALQKGEFSVRLPLEWTGPPESLPKRLIEWSH